MQTLTETVLDTETLDVTKLTWRRELHRPEDGSAFFTPWKALCGRVLYDLLGPARKGDVVCSKCEQVYQELKRGNA